MKYIVEHFGTGLLSGTAAVFLLTFFVKLVMQGGTINSVILTFVRGISG